MPVLLAIAATGARWRAIALVNSEQAIVQFEDLPPAEVFALGLYRDGVLPIEPQSN